MSKLFRNRDFILSLSLVLGLFAGGLAEWTQELTLPALALVMTLSTMGVGAQEFKSPGILFRQGLWGLGLNYILLAGILLALSRFFTHDQDIWDGFVLLALVPPAVAIIPFTQFLGGDSSFSLMATVGAYLGALLIMPVLAALHWSSDFVSPSQLLRILLMLIILPVIAAQILRITGLAGRIEPFKGAITNWSFFLVSYSIVGLNSGYILENPVTLLPVMAAAMASTFGLGLLIELAGKLLHVDRKRLFSMVLLGTLKNYGLAGGLALSIFSQRTALPAVVATTFMVVYIIWLGVLKRVQRMAE